MEKKVAKKKVAPKTTKKVASKTTKKVAPKTNKSKKKGFTLVELLAVIIILAIVVGISIPAVMSTINNTRKSAGKSAASVAAEWVDRQYQVAKSGLAVDTGSGSSVTLDSAFKTICGKEGSDCETTKTLNTAATDDTEKANAIDFIRASGLMEKNVTKMTVKVNSNGRSCVTIYVKSGSDYYDTSNDKATQTYKGGVC